MEKRKRRKFTREYKAKVVDLILSSGKSIGQVSGELGLTETSVRAWVKQAGIDARRDPHGPLTSEERAEVTRLRRELRTVTMERDFLKKAAAGSIGGRNASSDSRPWRAEAKDLAWAAVQLHRDDVEVKLAEG